MLTAQPYMAMATWKDYQFLLTHLLLQLLKLKEQREALKLQGQKHEDTIMKVLITILNDVEKEFKISCCNLHLCRKMPSFRRR